MLMFHPPLQAFPEYLCFKEDLSLHFNPLLTMYCYYLLLSFCSSGTRVGEGERKETFVVVLI